MTKKQKLKFVEYHRNKKIGKDKVDIRKIPDINFRVFDTGASRDTDKGKIDIDAVFPPELMESQAQYMLEHSTMPDGSTRSQSNWQKGMPIDTAYIKSLSRHFNDFRKVMRGHTVIDKKTGNPWTLEKLANAIVFNSNGILFEVLCKIGKAQHERND